MTDPAALLRTIVENPHDDAPRLALADLLQERGDPRGEFIAVQLGLTDATRWPPLTGEEYERLHRRERELLGNDVCAHCDWHAPLVHGGGWTWKYRRGFVARHLHARGLVRRGLRAVWG